MENSQLTVFLNVQPIAPQNNLPFDQTNKEFYLLLIFKKELLNFVLYFMKDLFLFCFMKYIYKQYLYSTLYRSADIFISYFMRELFT